jgi:hypothetical protein
MDSQLVETLKERHSYDTWRDNNTLEENLFIWKFFLNGNEFPNWRAHRIQPIEVPGQPPSIQSIWQLPTKDKTETLLNVNIYECGSRRNAHEFLVHLLGEFQSPLIVRQEQTPIGDIAFVYPGNTSILFSRANLVLLIRNVGRDLVSVNEFAQQLDLSLTSRPETEGVKVVPEIQRFQPLDEEFRTPSGVLLELEASDPLERPLWYKFFSRSGEVLLEGDRLTYQPQASGAQEATVFAINANRGAVSQRVEFSIENIRLENR